MTATRISADASGSGTSRRRPSRTTLLVAATVLLAPLIGVLFLRAPVVNGLLYRDPWFYSGYGWTLSHHIEVFGWFYYSVRFPVVLPIAWSSDVFGATAGYLVLHYAIMVGTGAVLYACVRRFSTRGVACAALVLLALSPFYLRAMLWDYTTFVTLPCTIGAVGLWFLSGRRRRTLVTSTLSGALIGAAVFANPLSALIVPALFGVESVAALRGGAREVGAFVVRGLMAVLGVVLVFGLGYLGYLLYLGGFSPRELVQPTIDFARANDQLSAPFQVPASQWLRDEPRIYAPVLACVGIVAALGPRLLENSLRSRIAQVAIAYTAVFWLFRVFVTSSLIETWWAYNMTAVTLCFAFPVILDALKERRHGARVLVVSAVAVTALTDLFIRSAHDAALAMYDELRSQVGLLAVALALTVVLVVAARYLPAGRLRTTALAGYFALVALFALTPAGYIGIRQTGEFSSFPGATELKSYGAAHRLAESLETSDQPPTRTLLWSDYQGLEAVGWTNLPHQQGGVQNPEAPTPLTALEPPGVDAVRYPTTSGLIVLAKGAEQIDDGLRELRRRGFSFTVSTRGSWVDGQLHYAHVRLSRAA